MPEVRTHEVLLITDDMSALFDQYEYEEIGRLFMAMMTYAFSGIDTEFEGNERFVWPVLKHKIDTQED